MLHPTTVLLPVLLVNSTYTTEEFRALNDKFKEKQYDMIGYPNVGIIWNYSPSRTIHEMNQDCDWKFGVVWDVAYVINEVKT